MAEKSDMDQSAAAHGVPVLMPPNQVNENLDSDEERQAKQVPGDQQ